MSKLATGLWVAAYRARLEAAGTPVYITAKGDQTAGAVLVKVATLDGNATLWQRSVDLLTGARAWVVLKKGLELDVDEAARKQQSFDPDLWVIEIESRDGAHLLDDPSLGDL